jgi:hypothetical protein
MQGGNGLRERYGFWHYHFMSNKKMYTGPTGLRATESNRKAAEAISLKMRLAAEGSVATISPFTVWFKADPAERVLGIVVNAEDFTEAVQLAERAMARPVLAVIQGIRGTLKGAMAA